MKETILIIEDDAGLLELLSEKVQECGYNTVCMLSAETASDWLNENVPYLIMLDYNLPDMNGKDFIAELKTKGKPVPPFLMSTGQGDERIAVDMMKLGARDYIIKDGNFLELIPLVISKVCKEIETENKIQLVEKALIESNQFNKQIIECAQEGIVVIDKNLNYLTWNPFMENLTGIKASELLGKNLIVVSSYLKLAGVLDNIENALLGMVVPEIESNFYFPLSQQSGWLLYSTSTLLNAVNETIGVILTVRNITERKITEQKLNESREAFKDLFNHAPVGYHEIDAEGRVVLMNQTELDMLGYTIEEQKGRCIWENSVNESESVKSTKEKLRGINIPSKPFGRYFRRKDGSTFPVSVQDRILCDNDGSIIGIRSTIQDITEQKKAENELRRSQEAFKDLFDHAPVGYHEIDAEGRIVRMNQTELNMHGYTSDEIIGKYIWEIAHNEFETRRQVEDKLKGKNVSSSSFETVLISKDGVKYPILIFDKILYDNDGNITGIRSTIQDITERKQAEEALRESEELYKTISENSNNAIFIINEFCKIEWTNQALLSSSGYSKEQILDAESFVKFVARESVEFASSNFGKVISGKEYIHQYQLRVICKNGEKRLCDKYMTHFIDRHGKLKVIVILTDITERHKAENALKESKNVLNKLLYASTDFIDSSSDAVSYSKLTDTILEISGAKYATFNLLDEQELEYTTVAISGLNDGLLRTKSVFGYELVNKKWKYDALKAKRIKNNAITKFETIHDLAENVLSKTFTTLIEKTFHIGETFVVKILKNDKLIGDFTLLFTKGSTLQNSEIVELFANQTGLYIDRQNTDKALRESEEKYRYLFANNPQPMYISDAETLSFIEVNDAAIKHYGYSKEEFLRMTIKDIRPKEDIPAFLLDIQDTIKSFKLAGEWRHIKKNGEIINVDITKVSVKSNGRAAIHVMVQDITERKRTEDALRVSEDKYRTMIENSNDLIWMLDIHGNFTFVNEMSINTTGFLQSEWIGKSFVPLIFPEDLSMIENIFQKSIKGENCNYELKLKKADQSILILSVNTSPIYIDGIVNGTVSFGRNITDKRFAEEALRESEEVYWNLVQRIPDGVYKSTSDGKFVDVNPAMVQMLGYDSKEEMLALDIKSQLYFDTPDRDNLVLREAHEEVGVFQLRKKDGTGIWIEDHGWYNIDENGDILFHEGILRDITERKLAEQILEEKMEQLLRFHKLTVDRELTMIELKKEINKMLINAGQPEKYRIVE